MQPTLDYQDSKKKRKKKKKKKKKKKEKKIPIEKTSVYSKCCCSLYLWLKG